MTILSQQNQTTVPSSCGHKGCFSYVIEGENVNFEEFGIEEEGPVPSIEVSETVSVPESLIQLSIAEVLLLRQEVSAVPVDEHGIMSYLTALGVLARIEHL